MDFRPKNQNTQYLELTDLTGVDRISKICYVVGHKSGISRQDSGFFTLYLKTVDGLKIRGMIFNVTDFIKKGFVVASLKGNFVRIKGTPQVWNGGYSIILDEVESVEHNEIDAEARERFIGKIENVDMLFEQYKDMFHKAVNEELPAIYKVASFPNICEGKIGGYVRFIDRWVTSVLPYCEEYGNQLVHCLYYSILYYAKYLQRVNMLDVVTTRDKLAILKSIPSGNESGVSRIVDDALQAILGLGRAEHLYANILYTTFVSTERLLKMGEQWKIIPNGGVSELSDYTLRRY